MEYIRQMNAFALKSVGILDVNASMVYFRLFMKANSNGWKDEWISVTNEYLMAMTGIGSHHTIIAARNKLKENGFIDFIPGGKHRPTMYKLLPLTGCPSVSCENQAPFQAKNQAMIQASNQADMPESVNQAQIQASNQAPFQADLPKSNSNQAMNRAVNRADVPEPLPTNRDNRLKSKEYAAAAAPAYEGANIIPFNELKKGRDAPPRWEEVVEIYEQIHPIQTAVEKDKLIDLVDTYTAEWVIEAVKEAIYCDGRSIRYVESILSRWQKDGFKSEMGRSTGTNGFSARNARRGYSHDRVSGGFVKKTSRSNRIDTDCIDWSKEPDEWV